jgi:hypothetical protein
MIIVIWVLITVAILAASFGVWGVFAGNDTDAPHMTNFFLFAIFLLLLAAIIKYVW